MVPITLGNILILSAAATFLVLLQPTLLGASASMCGEKKMGWGVRLAAIVVAGLAAALGQLFYGVSVGWFLARFGTIPVALGAVGVNFAVSSLVYSAFLRISWGRAATVAAVYWAMTFGIASVVGLGLKFFLS